MNEKDDRSIIYQLGLEVPEPWQSRMIELGYVNPRSGEASYRALSRETGLHQTTVSKLISGRADPRRVEPDTLRKIADALRVDVGKMMEWFNSGLSAEELEIYKPPPSSRMLTASERKMVDNLILSLVANHNKSDG